MGFKLHSVSLATAAAFAMAMVSWWFHGGCRVVTWWFCGGLWPGRWRHRRHLRRRHLRRRRQVRAADAHQGGLGPGSAQGLGMWWVGHWPGHVRSKDAKQQEVIQCNLNSPSRYKANKYDKLPHLKLKFAEKVCFHRSLWHAFLTIRFLCANSLEL